MVPVITIGFDLRDRVNAQNQQATEHTKKLADLKSRLEALALTTVHAISASSVHQRNKPRSFIDYSSSCSIYIC